MRKCKTSLPWWIKWAFSGGIGLLSAFAATVVPGLAQYFLSLLGALLVLASFVGTIAHLLKSHPVKWHKIAAVWGTAAIGIAIIVCIGWYVWPTTPKPESIVHLDVPPKPLTGTLTYGGLDTPLINCPKKTGVALGTSFFEITKFPADLVNIDGRTFLTIDQVRGVLTIKAASVLDADEKPILSIHDNSYWVRAGVHADTPVPYALVAYDKNEQMIFRATMMNDHTLSIEGVFSFRGHKIAITQKAVYVGDEVFGENCVLDFGLFINASGYGLRENFVP